jgi:hypothetical protein
MSGSSLDDKVLHTYEGHNGVSSHRSKGTCAPYPKRRDFYLFTKWFSFYIFHKKIR